MAYEAYEWADGEDGDTPIVAARLNALEQGVEDASEAAEAPVTWASVTSKPSTFAPATHTHVIGDVTGLQAALDALSDRLDELEAPEE